jgi:predicted CxxxxCH...CXXCH cytochrome family protein
MLVMIAGGCAVERDLSDAEPATGVHPSGMLDAASDNFHGKELARRGYDLALCASCHGNDFTGGSAKVTCRTCHPAGPDACETCHRGGPTTGAHVVHGQANQACSECHVVPARWDDEGHVRRNGAPDPAPAEVVLGPRAAQTLDPADREGAPAYANGTCSNVYCHGAVLHAGGGSASAPRWDATPVGGCGTCHGSPPPSHAQTECASCHENAPHLDGVLQVGGGCTGCHGDAAVFRDLSGSTLTTRLGVGAHQAHLSGASRLRGPLACSECHTTPATIADAGHLDSSLPAELFPITSTLARTAGAVPHWDRATATCSDAYCHGGGARFAGDASIGLVRSPMWTASDGQAYCGACHGIPPTTHAPDLTIFDCASCHPSVDAFGNPIVTGFPATSRHLDGVVDVF